MSVGIRERLFGRSRSYHSVAQTEVVVDAADVVEVGTALVELSVVDVISVEGTVIGDPCASDVPMR